MNVRQTEDRAANGVATGSSASAVAARVGVDDSWVTMDDGVRLPVRLWLPADCDETRVSAVLDAVPYRLSDGTAIGDAAWGTYFADHGLAFARVDLRGSGDADGLMVDEYTEREQRDIEAVIAWLADRSWSTGAVGMIGVSWGGFAGLQLARRAPDALRGVVAIHSSDDRYRDDVHYVGGCVSAMDMTQWATSMLAYLNQPPDPAVVGPDWRARWHARLADARPFIEPWLTHQRRDDYWRGGSACEDYAAIRCPVFAVGGWSDGYRDSVLRLVEHVDGPVRGLIGPWGHTGPEAGAPGPAIGFLQECVRFFAASLDRADNGFLDGPRLISYMQDPIGPGDDGASRAGRWVADLAWPSPAVTDWTLRVAADGLAEDAEQGESGFSDGSRRSDRIEASMDGAVAGSVRSPQLTGIDGGVWCGDGSPGDAPGDQRADDGRSLCVDGPPLSERVELLGGAVATLRVSVDRPQALVAVRVCDVAPDGSSALIARGILNLSRRDGFDRSVPMPVGEPVTVRVALQSTAYAVPAEHRVRLAISTSYWPWAWPSPEPVTLTLHASADNRLVLPRRDPNPLDDAPEPFGPPESGTPLASELTLRRDGGRTVRRDLATGVTEIAFDWHPTGTRILATATEMTEENRTVYRIRDGDPLSATVQCQVAVGLRRPGWDVRVQATSTMTCDPGRFTVTSTLDAFEDGVRVHARTFTHDFPRDGN